MPLLCRRKGLFQNFHLSSSSICFLLPGKHELKLKDESDGPLTASACWACLNWETITKHSSSQMRRKVLLFSVIIKAYHPAVRWQTWIQVTSEFNPAEIPPSIVIFGRESAEESAAFFFLRRLYFFCWKLKCVSVTHFLHELYCSYMDMRGRRLILY